ncbi:MAG: thymidine phosphorylase, partial [Parvibaculaceae bacterium]
EDLVLDVKTGSGAFMATPDEARALTESLVSVANGAGLKTSALITDMDEPLASAAGNAVEVMNAVLYLKGEYRDRRLHEVTVALGAQLLMLARVASTHDEARAMLDRALSSGKAAEAFAAMVVALGGPVDFLEAPQRHLAAAPLIRDVHPEVSGTVAAIDTRAIGLAVIALGGGRRVASDRIDHAVGFTGLAGKDAAVGKDQPLATVHARDEDAFEKAAAALRKAYRLGESPAASGPVIDRIGA